jgi:glyoxylase-like metal-dependent hydrolase (beta-lactamase superfamily II)
MSKLDWKLLTKKRGSSTQGLPPGKEDLAWVTNTVTLVYGERDAILVDTFLSVQHSKELLDWVAESGKNLTSIYITHAHGDHFLGLKLLLDGFPNVRAFATASVFAAMQNQIKPEFINSFWEPRFPSIGLLISGDAVFNNTHLYLAECDEKARSEWLRALDKIEALHPKAVVAGHGVLNPDSSLRHIEETRKYLHDFNSSLATTSTSLDLYEKMLALHPNRVNPGSLWATAKNVKPS